MAQKFPYERAEEDAKIIHAIAGAVKIVGELKITAEALEAPG